jgi:hypothetical protein
MMRPEALFQLADAAEHGGVIHPEVLRGGPD